MPVPQRLDPLSVTATHGLQPAADLLADVTVIGRDEIARSGAQSLAEVLQRQPGSEIAWYRYDDAADTSRLAGYNILNLTVEWDVAKNWTLFVRGNNVFDQDYQLAADFSTGGATVFAGVRWRL